MITISARLAPLTVLKLLAATILVLLALDVLATGISRAGVSYPDAILRMFDLDEEDSFGTWFTSALLLACSLPLFVVALWTQRSGRSFTSHWLLLGLLFVGLSIDESISIHENAIGPLQDGLGASGFLHYAWVVPAMIFVVVLGALYIPFLRHLPPRFSMLFAVAGAVYVGGALGLEFIEGALAESRGTFALSTMAVQRTQETLEMAGAALFLYGLGLYMRDELGVKAIGLALAEEASVNGGAPRVSDVRLDAAQKGGQRLGSLTPNVRAGSTGGL